MTDRETMQRIMQVLGPNAVCVCAGCSWETEEALRMLRAAGIEYQYGRGVMGPMHEPELESLGNAVEERTDGLATAKRFGDILAELRQLLDPSSVLTYDELPKAFAEHLTDVRTIGRLEGVASVVGDESEVIAIYLTDRGFHELAQDIRDNKHGDDEAIARHTQKDASDQLRDDCPHVQKGAIPGGVMCRDCRKEWRGEAGDAVWKAMSEVEPDITLKAIINSYRVRDDSTNDRLKALVRELDSVLKS